MKKSLTGVVVLLAGAFVAHSQGTVGFGNYGSGYSTYVYVSLQGGAKLGGAAAPNTGNFATDVPNGNDWTVALYGAAGEGDAASTLLPLQTALSGGVPVTATFANGSPTYDEVAGTWYSGVSGVVPGTTGPIGGGVNSATVQLYAWYNAGGTITSYSQALATPGTPTGFSATANVAALGGPAPGGNPPVPGTALPTAALGNFTVSTVPEPSTIALGVMGASAFLMRLRKKQ